MNATSTIGPQTELTQQDVQKQALDFLSKQPSPDTQLESWRKINLSDFNHKTFQLNESNSNLDFQVAALPENPTTPSDESRTHIMSLEDALKEPALASLIQQDLSQEWQDSQQQHNLGSIINLAHCQPESSRVIRLGGTCGVPHTAIHKIVSGDCLLDRMYIIVEPNADVSLLEEFLPPPASGSGDTSVAETPGHVLWAPVTRIIVQQNARLRYAARYQTRGQEWHFSNMHVSLQRDARALTLLLNNASYKGKIFATADTIGSGAEYRGLGITTGSGRSFLDMEMLVRHLADHTTSSLLYKTVLKDRAHSIFNGNLAIPAGMKGVDSHQENHNILLDKKARAQSMPNLNIHAEQVAAEHGATVGELDQQALFFLMARGLTEKEARNLLIEAFITRVVEEIDWPDQTEQILLAIRERLDL